MTAESAPALDVQTKRLLLFSTKLRFSPETQLIRESAIANLVEQSLLLSENGMTALEIQSEGALCFLEGASALPIKDLESTLSRLIEAGRVTAVDEAGEEGIRRYRLVDIIKTDLWHVHSVAEQNFRELVNKMFRGIPGGASLYGAPFLESLSRVFARLGEKYVRHLKGDLPPKELMLQPDVLKSFQEIQGKYPKLDIRVIEQAVYKVFEENDPTLVHLKWNLGQNYYIAKTLGLDPSGRLLSREVFGGGILYLDTNVMLEALTPGATHYGSFQALTKGCSDLQINLAACQISVDELRKVIVWERLQIEKVAKKVPDELLHRVKGILFPLYVASLKDKGSVDLDELFASFAEPSVSLKESYGVEIIDSDWFDLALKDPNLDALVDQVQQAYTRPWRGKARNAAIHDALLLAWLQQERADKFVNAWLVTLDHSLPDFHAGQSGEMKPLAVTLDALVHWMSPMRLGDDDSFAEIFSEAIRRNLLPQDNIFDIRDFLVFAEMEWATKELPAEDVEECIRHVKATVPYANPGDPKDRELISREMVRFFADPGRKYKTIIQDTEKQLLKKDEEIEKAWGIAANHKSAADLLESNLAAERLRNSALGRLGLMFLLFLAFEAGSLELIWYFVDGATFIQKVSHGWTLFASMPVVSLVLTWFYIGQDRLRSLGWPFTAILKVPDKKD